MVTKAWCICDHLWAARWHRLRAHACISQRSDHVAGISVAIGDAAAPPPPAAAVAVVCGMFASKVEVPGVENINLSRLVSGHQDYLSAMEDILEAMNMHDT